MNFSNMIDTYIAKNVMVDNFISDIKLSDFYSTIGFADKDK